MSCWLGCAGCPDCMEDEKVPRNKHGHHIGMEEYEREEAREVEEPVVPQYTPSFAQVRAHYAQLVKEKALDAVAVQKCIDEFGFKTAVRALKAASPKAQQLFSRYAVKFLR